MTEQTEVVPTDTLLDAPAAPGEAAPVVAVPEETPAQHRARVRGGTGGDISHLSPEERRLNGWTEDGAGNWTRTVAADEEPAYAPQVGAVQLGEGAGPMSIGGMDPADPDAPAEPTDPSRVAVDPANVAPGGGEVEPTAQSQPGPPQADAASGSVPVMATADPAAVPAE